jgi:hypothetical protein
MKTFYDHLKKDEKKYKPVKTPLIVSAKRYHRGIIQQATCVFRTQKSKVRNLVLGVLYE